MNKPMALEIDGHTIALSNLDKVLYPATGTTKAEVIHYYSTVSVHLLDELADRPVTRRRWPDGVGGITFFEKNISSGTPDWVTRATLPTPGSGRGVETLAFPIIDSLAALVWHATMAALELHTPQWRLGPDGPLNPDRLVIDLDPGPGTGLPECARVALLVRDRLQAADLDPWPVTSGSKGLQLYATLPGTDDFEVVREQVKALAEELEREAPTLVVSTMAKAARVGKVFLDWSQNSASKTTITPWSLRGRDAPTAAVPREWAELEDGAELRQLTLQEALARV